MELLTASGIYEILNTANGKRYIGSAVNIARRRVLHLWHLRRGTHTNAHLQAAWNKYDADVFVCKPLLICVPKDLIPYEQRCFDAYKPEYNKAPVAGSLLGFKHSADTKSKIAAAGIGRIPSKETRVKRSRALAGTRPSAACRAASLAANTGRSASKETRAAMSKTRLGKPWSAKRHAAQAALSAARIGKSLSPETREKISRAQKAHWARVRASA